MKDKIFSNKIHIVVFSSVFLILIFFYIVLLLLNRDIIAKYDNVILPNVYLDGYDMSNYDYDEALEVLETRRDDLLSRKVLFLSEGNELEVSLSDIGLKINQEKTLSDIQKYQEKLNYTKKLWFINGHGASKSFRLYFTLDDDSLNTFFSTLEKRVNIEPVDGHFDTAEGVRYVKGVDGFRLNYEKSKDIIKKYFNGNYDPLNMKIELVGDVVESNTNENYFTIDTMTSSFITTFDWIPLRIQNLQTGVNYVNGAIVEPGEVFSFFQYAGPYNKAGFVFYYEYVGNGVCQVATTVYDAALLGGLEIVARSPHKKKSVYVAGGLDATVASANDGSWNTDMKFRNTYKYPIYIKAYIVGNEIHVEFWSNHDAMEGKTYSTESVWLGGRGYRTFLHTYKDGVEISRDVITTTWYPED